MSQVFCRTQKNRLEVIFSGPNHQEELERLSLETLREAASLRPGFDVFVDASHLRVEDPALIPILSKVLGSLQWFEVGRLFHLSQSQGNQEQLRMLYEQSGIYRTVAIEETSDSAEWESWMDRDESKFVAFAS